MKKTLAIILAITLLCIMAVGSTLTYFTDTDFEDDTMTVGNVKIENVYDFGADKLYPYIGEIPSTGDYVEANNAVKKQISVKNVGSEAAYIRTLFAFEVVDFNSSNPVNPVGTKIHVNYNAAAGSWESLGFVTVGSTDYVVYSFTYTGEVAANTTTAISLKQIALDSSVGNEFNAAIGDNGKYDILVLSQAVQAQGFTGDGMGAAYALNTAFGEVNASNAAKWFTNLPNN